MSYEIKTQVLCRPTSQHMEALCYITRISQQQTVHIQCALNSLEKLKYTVVPHQTDNENYII